MSELDDQLAATQLESMPYLNQAVKFLRALMPLARALHLELMGREADSVEDLIKVYYVLLDAHTTEALVAQYGSRGQSNLDLYSQLLSSGPKKGVS